ncbi:hypothetical protein GGR56DRAFT_637993 [Xylariaceae sp. FL0804]|nr:hypothetical protein GGR56DRAFT_637993 [Xylariaceae sp. FL0804]
MLRERGGRAVFSRIRPPWNGFFLFLAEGAHGMHTTFGLPHPTDCLFSLLNPRFNGPRYTSRCRVYLKKSTLVLVLGAQPTGFPAGFKFFCAVWNGIWVSWGFFQKGAKFRLTLS